MKLLTHPGRTTDRVTLGGTYKELRTEFNPLCVFGIGPLSKTREVTHYSPEMHFPGRMRTTPIKIDFEGDGEDPFRICVYYSDEFFGYLKVRRPEGWDLELDGVKYCLFGILPSKHIEGSIWECTIDHYKDSLNDRLD